MNTFRMVILLTGILVAGVAATTVGQTMPREENREIINEPRNDKDKYKAHHDKEKHKSDKAHIKHMHEKVKSDKAMHKAEKHKAEKHKAEKQKHKHHDDTEAS